MRLDDSQGKSKEWQDHMDWHVKQNLARHGSNNSAAVPYRQWYPSTSTWLTPRASDETNEQEADKPEEPLPGVASSGVKTKECSVCGEKFDEYYDDDEETWRLRDTVNVHGKVKICYSKLVNLSRFITDCAFCVCFRRSSITRQLIILQRQ